MDPQAELTIEATGETVGEAKWVALRELERLHPGLDKATVRFQVLSEGERGLLGVGYTPARVLAALDPGAAPEPPRDRAPDESEPAARLRNLLERVSAEIGVQCRIEVTENEDALVAQCQGADLGLLIGKHGQMIDAVQYLANAIVYRGNPDRKPVVVDAAGYRERRRATVDSLALRGAERVVASGEPVLLEAMSPVERKLVHVCLQDVEGVQTRSEGAEPNRYVVIEPAPEQVSGDSGGPPAGT